MKKNIEIRDLLMFLLMLILGVLLIININSLTTKDKEHLEFQKTEKALNNFCLDDLNSQTEICIQRVIENKKYRYINKIFNQSISIQKLIEDVNEYKSYISKSVCINNKSKSTFKECKPHSELAEDINKLKSFDSSSSYEESKEIEKIIIKLEKFYKENYPKYYKEYKSYVLFNQELSDSRHF